MRTLEQIDADLEALSAKLHGDTRPCRKEHKDPAKRDELPEAAKIRAERKAVKEQRRALRMERRAVEAATRPDPRALSVVKAELEQLNAQRDALRVRAGELAQELADAVARQRVDAMPARERDALARAIRPAGIPSGEKFGVPGGKRK